MSTRRVADIVLCIDASTSMQPCFDAVRRNVEQLVSGLQSTGQSTWDVRFDFLAHQASEAGGGFIAFHYESLRYPTSMQVIDAIYGKAGANGAQAGAGFFTKDVEEFKRALG